MLLQSFDSECAAPTQSGGAADVVDIATTGKINPKLCQESQLIEDKEKK